MAHPFLVAELARLSATRRPTLWSTAFETCARNLFNPPHENIPDTIFAITVRNGGVVEIDFFYGPIILSSCFSMPRL